MSGRWHFFCYPFFSVNLAANLSAQSDLKEVGRKLEDSETSLKQLLLQVGEPDLSIWAVLVFLWTLDQEWDQESAVTPLLNHYVIFSSTSQQYSEESSHFSEHILFFKSFFNLLNAKISMASAPPFCQTCQDNFSFIHSFIHPVNIYWYPLTQMWDV